MNDVISENGLSKMKIGEQLVVSSSPNQKIHRGQVWKKVESKKDWIKILQVSATFITYKDKFGDLHRKTSAEFNEMLAKERWLPDNSSDIKKIETKLRNTLVQMVGPTVALTVLRMILPSIRKLKKQANASFQVSS